MLFDGIASDQKKTMLNRGNTVHHILSHCTGTDCQGRRKENGEIDSSDIYTTTKILTDYCSTQGSVEKIEWEENESQQLHRKAKTNPAQYVTAPRQSHETEDPTMRN